MNLPPTFREWASESGRRPLVMALARLLVEEKPDGVDDLVKEFRRLGYGRQVNSWVHKGRKMSLTPEDVRRVLGDEVIDDLAVDADMPLDEAQMHLARIVPEFVSLLCPEHRWEPEAAKEILVDYLSESFAEAESQSLNIRY